MTGRVYHQTRVVGDGRTWHFRCTVCGCHSELTTSWADAERQALHHELHSLPSPPPTHENQGGR